MEDIFEKAEILPMTITLEANDGKYSVTCVDAHGSKSPPLMGKTPSEALCRLAYALDAAVEIADVLIRMVVDSEAKLN